MATEREQYDMRHVSALTFPGTIPSTCFWHRWYDCWQCHPRVAIEAASDEERRRAGLPAKEPDDG